MRYKLRILILFIFSLSCEENDSTASPNNTSLDGVTVEIIDPNNYENTTPNNNLTFRGVVSTETPSDLTGLRANWVSDKDGLIYEQNINETGETSFSISTLSKNIHNIKLNVINEVDSTISDSIEIYNAIKLFPIEKTNNSSTLTWCSVQDISFQSFELYRSRFKSGILQDDPIYTTTNIQDTTFLDTTAILGEKHFYKVILKRTIQTPDRFESNIDSVYTGNFFKTNYPILKVIADPNRSYAYGIVNTSSIYDDNETGYGLIFINLNELSVENRILQNTRFSDLDIGPSGNYLYLASRSSNIHKINLNTQTLESTISLSRSAHKIEVGNNGKLYYHITPPTSGSTEFRIYNLNNNTSIPYNTNIPDAYSSFRHGDFEIDENNILYHGASNSSGSELSKIGTTNDNFSLINQWNSGNYQSARIVLNNNKLYWNHYLLDLELNILGTFQNINGNTDIQDVSSNGETALGWCNLFKSSDQSIIKEVPAYYDSGIFIQDHRILLYNTDNPLYQQYESIIYLYDFN
ncbi:hypothetical protein [uncultured Winogradskyella sp.]|uniref:YncE family protein n=1 Tax=uncultured Winogradskyella sp. TaxID=395353 RepID=UPI002615F69E|nr:hypothetical protein [uncultured Winogradskyella sp.]